MTTSDTIRVLIADDHVTVLEGLAAIIGRQADMQVVAEAENGHEALEHWLAYRPDVTLLDLRMPLLNGISVPSKSKNAATAAGEVAAGSAARGEVTTS